MTKISPKKSGQIFTNIPYDPPAGSWTWVPTRGRSLREWNDVLFPLLLSTPFYAGFVGPEQSRSDGTNIKSAYIESPRTSHFPHTIHAAPLFTPSKPVEGFAISVFQTESIGGLTPDTERVTSRTNPARIRSYSKVQVDERRCEAGCLWLCYRGTHPRWHRGSARFALVTIH